MLRRTWPAVMAVTMMVPSLCLAQQQQLQQTPPPPNIGAQRQLDTSARQGTDQESNDELVNYLAAKMMVANQAEIQVAQMAADKTDNDDVKQLAQQIVQDHQKLNQTLQQRMPQLAQMVNLEQSHGQSTRSSGQSNAQQGSRPNAQGNQASQAGQNQPGQNQPGQNQSGQQRGGQEGLNGNPRNFAQQTGQPLDGAAKRLLQIAEQSTRNQLDMTMKLFQQHQGQDFNMAFLGQQIAGHTWLISELKAIQNIGPQELQQIAQQAEQLSEQHFTRAKQLAEQLEDKERTSQRPEDEAIRR